MVAEPVPESLIPSPAFQQLCDDLLETMDEYDGAGLAAPQVHVSLRVVCLTLRSADGPEFLINPEIEVLSDTTSRTWEGCLSVEGMRGLVERPDHIKVTAFNREGERIAYELRGFPAVVTQHECDHLDGVIYIDRALPRSLMFVREYRRWGPPEEYADDDAYDDEDESLLDLDEE
jgi:peptide deformylase